MHVAQWPQTYSCDIPTHKTTSPQERPFSHYTHSNRLAAEMWTMMKNNLLGKIFLSCSFYLYRFRKYVSYGFPIINFCNPGVHYETPSIIVLEMRGHTNIKLDTRFRTYSLVASKLTFPHRHFNRCFKAWWKNTRKHPRKRCFESWQHTTNIPSRTRFTALYIVENTKIKWNIS